MTKHLPEAPLANRSAKGPGERHKAPSGATPAKHQGDVYAAVQGDSASIQQNTTNEGFFRGRRVK